VVKLDHILFRLHLRYSCVAGGVVGLNRRTVSRLWEERRSVFVDSAF
jgi:hypothetical protein